MTLDCIVGTGPAGISAAKALTERGRRVILIDPGAAIELEKLAVKTRLGSAEPAAWSSADLARFKSNLDPTTKGVGQKNVYGSDYVFRVPAHARPVKLIRSKMMRTFAPGGLSNVWGACLLPYPGNEIDDWPAAARNLAPFYEAVSSFLPMAGRADGLSRTFPIYNANLNGINLSRQAARLLQDLEKNAAPLRGRGFTFGASRLALRNSPGNGAACRYCGLCLYGCPYDLIYSSAHTLEALKKSGAAYRNDLIVTRIEEKASEVFVHARNTRTGAEEKIACSKVFLAAGVVESARIMLESLGAYGIPLKAKHSDRFTLPFLRYDGVAGVYDEKLHTLSQVFIELSDPQIAPNSVHLQVYTYNDLYRKVFDKKLGPLAKALGYPIRKFLEHLLIMFGYFHSDESSTLTIELEKSAPGILSITGHPNPAARDAFKRVRRAIRAARSELRGIPVTGSLDLPGGGNHSGATFPMRERPGSFESDVQGRPYGYNNLHIVDSSVFPSLPSTTITYTSMANAYRIATQAVS